MSTGNTNGATSSNTSLPERTAPVKKKIVKKSTLANNAFGTARKFGDRPQQVPGPKPGVTRNGASHPLEASGQNGQQAAATAMPASKDATSLFSDPEVLAGRKQVTDYRLVTTRRALLEGLRFHMMELTQGMQPIDIRDPKHFPRPAHLHRKDFAPEDQTEIKDDVIKVEDGLTEAERQVLADKKAARLEEKAANLAQIAPTQTTRKQNNKPRTKEVYKRNFSEEDKIRIKTNYEEKTPWLLEARDGKRVFVGSNQMTNARRNVALIYEREEAGNGKFRLVPIEKAYDFKKPVVLNAKPGATKAMTIEEAESSYRRKKDKAPNWLLGIEDKALRKKEQERRQNNNSAVFTGFAGNQKTGARGGEDADLDFDSDELFADDEEGDHFLVKDEDEKLAETRIKEENLKANYFENKSENEYDRESEEERKREEAERRYGKGYRKALEKEEHNFNHASDSEYSSSENESELERESKEALKKQLNLPGSQNPTPSGANTPRNRDKDRSDRESAVSGFGRTNGLKRPGSPIMSDASGTDTSARKKHKSKHLSAGGPSSSAVLNGTKIKLRMGNAGSDTEANLSDATRRLKNKHHSKVRTDSQSTAGTPSGSRAGSPAPNGTGRPGPPTRPGSTAPPSATTEMPTEADIKARILASLPKGMGVSQFITSVPHPKERKAELIQLILRVAKKQGDILVLKEGGE